MSNPIPLSETEHKNTRVITTRSAEYGDDHNLCAVVPREFNRLVAHYPILINRDPNTQNYNFVVLLGFARGENLFLEGDSWDATYIPLEVLRRPFVAGVHGDTDDPQATIYIDSEDPRVNQDEGELLFDENGQPTNYMKAINNVLAELVTGVEQTKKMMALLTKYDLIKPIKINIGVDVEGKPLDIEGFFSISDEKVIELSKEAIAEFHEAGYLPHIYIQQATSAHIATLIERKNQLLKRQAAGGE